MDVDGDGDLKDASRMIGIVARLGGGKRALAVGLGSGGPAGEPVCYWNSFIPHG